MWGAPVCDSPGSHDPLTGSRSLPASSSGLPIAIPRSKRRAGRQLVEMASGQQGHTPYDDPCPTGQSRTHWVRVLPTSATRCRCPADDLITTLTGAP
jgi:hypothetical protein